MGTVVFLQGKTLRFGNYNHLTPFKGGPGMEVTLSYAKIVMNEVL